MSNMLIAVWALAGASWLYAAYRLGFVRGLRKALSIIERPRP